MTRAAPILMAGAAACLLAACSSGTSNGGPPSWEPSPGFTAPGAQVSPIIPIPSRSGGAGGGTGGGGSSNGATPGPSRKGNIDPAVVATDLTAPVGLTLMPDGTALVGERTTGRIVRVQPVAGKPVPTVRILHGLDTSGDGGLLDLALSPTFSEDGLVYAYVTTPTDNRVVDFTLTGPVTPVLTGIPKGRTGNTGRIEFGPDGDLYIGTGDAGHPALAANPHSLAGKVLRVDDIGDPLRSNPRPGSPIWTSGHQVVDGLCPVPRTSWTFEVEAGAHGSADEVNLLRRGMSYAGAAGQAPVATLPSGFSNPGGCAILGGRIWVTSLDGDALLSAPLEPTSATTVKLGQFTAVLKNKYGRLRTVVAADDGALWLTTSNRDGHGNPVPTDERVIRYVPKVPGGHSPF